jgi:hypothetical protein
MFTEFHFHDVVLGVFSMVGWVVSDAYKYWAKNSVGDIVDMLMQALEQVTQTRHIPYGYNARVSHSFTT